jgi:hypothetical protein
MLDDLLCIQQDPSEKLLCYFALDRYLPMENQYMQAKIKIGTQSKKIAYSSLYSSGTSFIF